MMMIVMMLNIVTSRKLSFMTQTKTVTKITVQAIIVKVG